MRKPKLDHPKGELNILIHGYLEKKSEKKVRSQISQKIMIYTMHINILKALMSPEVYKPVKWNTFKPI